MKKSLIILVTIVMFCLVLSSAAAAAIPNNTVIVGNRGYDLGYLETDVAAQTAVITGIAHAYIVLGGNMLRATDGSRATDAEIAALPEINYIYSNESKPGIPETWPPHDINSGV